MTLCTIDFETHSEANLPKVGPQKYAQHHTTGVMCLYWRIEGRELECWLPLEEDDYVPLKGIRRKNPDSLFLHIAQGDIVEAHNAGFEQAIWVNVCVPMYGWPALPLVQTRCSAAKAAVRALPRSLAGAGAALGLAVQKDSHGHRVMMKLCKPKKPSKADPSTRILPPTKFDLAMAVLASEKKRLEQARQDFDDMYAYCGDDVLAEEELSSRIANLTPAERRVWELDQKANQRGIRIDDVSVAYLLRLLDEKRVCLNEEVMEITGGALPNMNSQVKVRAYFAENGFVLKDYKAFTIEQIVEKRLVEGVLLRLLQIRQSTAKVSVKKLDAMVARACSDGTVKDNLMYHGASTGRWTGTGLQLHNLTRPEPGFDQDMAFVAIEEEWGLDEIEMIFGDVFQFASNCIRGCLIAHPGYDFMSADFSSIEARVLVWLAGDEEALDVFRNDGDIYIEMASEIYNRPINKKDDPEERQLGKMAILGCFGAETPVLTDRGWVPIIEVSATDTVWDGEEFVSCRGPIYQGQKEVLSLHGVRVTPEHLVLTTKGWVEAQEVERLGSICFRNSVGILATSKFSGTIEAPGETLGTSVTPEVEIPVYDLLNCGPRSRFTIWTDAGPAVVHNCGYQMGHKTFREQAWSQWGVRISEELSKLAIKSYRAKYDLVVKLWRDQEKAAITCVQTGKPQTAGYIRWGVRGNYLHARLPSGRLLSYFAPRIESREVPWSTQEKPVFKDVVTYMTNIAPSRKWGRDNFYGGKIVENCLAGDTEVLTKKGWKPLDQYAPGDLLWDGENWVCGGKLLDRGLQGVIEYAGVLLTPDHEVLTEKGWADAASAKSQGLTRYPVGIPHGRGIQRIKREKVPMGSGVRVWEGDNAGQLRDTQTAPEVVRVQEAGGCIPGQQHTRHVQTPGLCGVAFHEGPLPPTHAPSVEELRGARHYRVLPVGQLCRLLGGHGTHVPAGVDAGEAQQRRGLLPPELRVGEPESAVQQQTSERAHRDPLGEHDGCASLSPRGAEPRDRVLPGPARLGGGQPSPAPKPQQQRVVYDILNVGPRRRFTVRGASGEVFLVHNCVQAIARDLMSEAALRVEEKGYLLVVSVHDELVNIVKKGEGSLEEFERLMGVVPAWASGCPIVAEGWRGKRYRK